MEWAKKNAIREEQVYEKVVSRSKEISAHSNVIIFIWWLAIVWFFQTNNSVSWSGSGKAWLAHQVCHTENITTIHMINWALAMGDYLLHVLCSLRIQTLGIYKPNRGVNPALTGTNPADDMRRTWSHKVALSQNWIMKSDMHIWQEFNFCQDVLRGILSVVWFDSCLILFSL